MNPASQAVMFGKASDEWTTPQAFYDSLNAEFMFQWDSAAVNDSAKCGGHCYFGPDHSHMDYRDALAVPEWRTYQRERFWLNPPYSKCREFIAKAAAEAKRGATVVCLVPSRTDTRWWHEHVWDDVRHRARPGVEIRFQRGRLKFGGTGKPENSAPFPSVVVICRPPIFGTEAVS